MPDLLSDGDIRTVEADLVEETSFEGRIQVLRQVGSSDENAIQRFHFLQDDVLDAVLHLVYSVLGTFHPLAENGVGFIEEKNRSHLRTLYQQTIPVEHGLYILFRVTYPLALDFGNVDGQNAAAGLSRKLINGLRLSCPRGTVEQAGESAAVSSGLHPLPNLLVTFRHQESFEFIYLFFIAVGVEECFLYQ